MVRLSKLSYVSAIFSIPLWVLSFAWIPFGFFGLQTPIIIPIFGEVGALLSALLAIVSGTIARRRPQLPEERRLASRGLTMGAIVLALIVGLNSLGLIFFQ